MQPVTEVDPAVHTGSVRDRVTVRPSAFDRLTFQTAGPARRENHEADSIEGTELVSNGQDFGVQNGAREPTAGCQLASVVVAPTCLVLTATQEDGGPRAEQRMEIEDSPDKSDNPGLPADAPSQMEAQVVGQDPKETEVVALTEPIIAASSLEAHPAEPIGMQVMDPPSAGAGKGESVGPTAIGTGQLDGNHAHEVVSDRTHEGRVEIDNGCGAGPQELVVTKKTLL